MKTTTFDLAAAESKWRPGRPNPSTAIVGRRAVFTTFDGAQLVGTVEAPLTGPAGTGRFPIVRFDSGKWARLDSQVELIAR